MWEVVVASLEGRFDDAERMAEELHLRLQQIGHPQSELTYVGQTIGWRWLQGRAGEYLPIFEALAVGDPATLTWPAPPARCAAQSGATERAGGILPRIPPAAAAALHRHYPWWVAVAGFGPAAGVLDGRRAGPRGGGAPGPPRARLSPDGPRFSSSGRRIRRCAGRRLVPRSVR